MTAKVNLEIAKVNRLLKSQGQNLACISSELNFMVKPKPPLNSAKPTFSARQSSSIVSNFQWLTVSKFNTRVLSQRGAAWK